MKTMQELYNAIMGSQELKAQFIEAAKAGKQEEFLKANGCEATLEEVKTFLEARQKEDAPLALDELENSAGGECNNKTKKDIGMSIGLLGLGCLLQVACSGISGHVGQRKEGESRLCND